jgi:ribonuclease J
MPGHCPEKIEEVIVNMSSKPLRIIPLGGLGEVGRNMMVYEYDDEILVVDAGLMFPENDMLGIDYIIPDLTYLSQNRNKVRGIVITHGHEDHIGAIHHLLNEGERPHLRYTPHPGPSGSEVGP